MTSARFAVLYAPSPPNAIVHTATVTDRNGSIHPAELARASEQVMREWAARLAGFRGSIV
jgi:hypothetical protein